MASPYPETIGYVELYEGNRLIFAVYVEPFTLDLRSDWMQGSG